MLEALYCCGQLHECRNYFISSNKILQFVDECSKCGSCVAQIVKFVRGKHRVVVRKKNKQALQLLQRYFNSPIEYKELGGTYANSLIYYNNRGTIFDFNNCKVGENEDFVSHSAH